MNSKEIQKKIFLLCSAFLLLCTIGSTQAMAQEQDDLTFVFTQEEVDTKAIYHGESITAFSKAFSSVFISPDTPKKTNYIVIASFIVETDGRVTDVQIIKGDEFGMGDAVISALSRMQTVRPAIKDGKNVRSRFLMPFTIQGNGKLKVSKKK